MEDLFLLGRNAGEICHCYARSTNLSSSLRAPVFSMHRGCERTSTSKHIADQFSADDFRAIFSTYRFRNRPSHRCSLAAKQEIFLLRNQEMASLGIYLGTHANSFRFLFEFIIDIKRISAFVQCLSVYIVHKVFITF